MNISVSVPPMKSLKAARSGADSDHLAVYSISKPPILPHPSNSVLELPRMGRSNAKMQLQPFSHASGALKASLEVQTSRPIRIAWLFDDLGLPYKVHCWDQEF